MSTIFISPANAAREREVLIRLLHLRTDGILFYEKERIRAEKALEDITHCSPVLGILGRTGNLEIRDRMLEDVDKLEGDKIEDAEALKTVMATIADSADEWMKAEKELDAEIDLSFYVKQWMKTAELIWYTGQYLKEKEETEERGGIFTIKYDEWLRIKPAVIVVDQKESWVEYEKQKREELMTYEMEKSLERVWKKMKA
ncbi:hypothetical protein N0V90_005220 [Kalmusia sp. IMI 367209]|nr:hypothetical protein N0V90_005220 [Kalmusia sp. IMI 367209]